MEELLPLESYYARSELTVRRLAAVAGSAFGSVMGAMMGVSIASAVGSLTAAVAGLVTAVVSGSAFAGLWGWSMLRMRRVQDERAYDNEARLMGESLEDSFRYRMPCSLVQGRRLVSGTLYLDRERGAFVPVRRLADAVGITRFSLAPGPLRTVPWHEGSRWARWTLGEPLALEVGGADSALLFLTPDSELALARLKEHAASLSRFRDTAGPEAP